VSGAAPVLLAGLGGAAVAVAIREWSKALPSVVAQLAGALRILILAGRENRAPSEVERRRLGLIAGVGLAAAAVVLTGFGPLAGVAAAGPSLASWALGRRRRRYRARVEESIPTIADAVADSIAAGGSLRTALVTAKLGLEGPAAVEMARAGADLDVGLSPRAALTGLAARLGSDRVDALVAAVLSQERTGGDLARLLRRHAEAAIDRSRAEKEARSATAQARMTGGMVVGMPVALALVVEAVAPGFLAAMLSEPVAAVLLVVAVALQVAGFVAIRILGRVG